MEAHAAIAGERHAEGLDLLPDLGALRAELPLALQRRVGTRHVQRGTARPDHFDKISECAFFWAA